MAQRSVCVEPSSAVLLTTSVLAFAAALMATTSTPVSVLIFIGCSSLCAWHSSRHAAESCRRPRDDCEPSTKTSAVESIRSHWQRMKSYSVDLGRVGPVRQARFAESHRPLQIVTFANLDRG